MAGAVHRLHGDSFAKRIARTKGLNIALAIVGAVLPVAIGINGQVTVIAVVGGAGKLILPRIHIGDGEGTGDGQNGPIVFTGRTCVGTADHSAIIGAVDGNGQIVIGAIHRLDGNGVNQRITTAQRLNGGLTVAGAVIPGTSRVQGN